MYIYLTVSLRIASSKNRNFKTGQFFLLQIKKMVRLFWVLFITKTLLV